MHSAPLQSDSGDVASKKKMLWSGKAAAGVCTHITCICICLSIFLLILLFLALFTNTSTSISLHISVHILDMWKYTAFLWLHVCIYIFDYRTMRVWYWCILQVDKWAGVQFGGDAARRDKFLALMGAKKHGADLNATNSKATPVYPLYIYSMHLTTCILYHEYIHTYLYTL